MAAGQDPPLRRYDHALVNKESRRRPRSSSATRIRMDDAWWSGASSAIDVETGRPLASPRAEVIMPVRNRFRFRPNDQRTYDGHVRVRHCATAFDAAQRLVDDGITANARTRQFAAVQAGPSWAPVPTQLPGCHRR
jgi:hypothetical protein